MLPKNVLLYGNDGPLPERIGLRAGPLHMYYENGDLRYIKFGDREVLRRIYVAIRDRNWGTTPPVFSNLEMKIQAESFQISYDIENKQGEIDFAWHGEITGSADGTLRFSMEGEARSTFWKNRIGFCVLHPALLSGVPCVVEHVDGSQEEAPLPVLISPDQPVKPFGEMQGISHEIIPGVRANMQFSGDIFEVEDQRNWTDASYKTFCTPLRLPYPVEVQAGTRINQAITLEIHDTRSSSDTGGTLRAEAKPLNFTVGQPDSALRLPPIGLGTASHDQSLARRELERLKALNLSHLRVDLRLSEPTNSERLKRTWQEAKSLGIPLEVALLVSREDEAELQGLRRLLDELQPRILRWLVYPDKEIFLGGSPTAQAVALAHKSLDGYHSGIEFCSGTNTDFIFMQRTMPPLDQIDAVTLAITAEMHAFDESSIVETLEAQPMVVASARQRAQGKPVVISPVTFKMRHNPYATGPWPVIRPGELPPMVEVRQMSLFGAAWTLGSLKALAESGAHSLTYYETSGWRGVMETQAGSTLADIFRSLPGCVFPMYHIFADAGEFAGGEVIKTRTSDNLRIEGIALQKNGRRRVMVANMTAEPQTVRICNLGAKIKLRWLDETNAIQAMQSPEEYRSKAGEPCATQEGAVELLMHPYGVACLDYSSF